MITYFFLYFPPTIQQKIVSASLLLYVVGVYSVSNRICIQDLEHGRELVYKGKKTNTISTLLVLCSTTSWKKSFKYVLYDYKYPQSSEFICVQCLKTKYANPEKLIHCIVYCSIEIWSINLFVVLDYGLVDM